MQPLSPLVDPDLATLRKLSFQRVARPFQQRSNFKSRSSTHPGTGTSREAGVHELPGQSAPGSRGARPSKGGRVPTTSLAALAKTLSSGALSTYLAHALAPGNSDVAGPGFREEAELPGGARATARRNWFSAFRWMRRSTSLGC